MPVESLLRAEIISKVTQNQQHWHYSTNHDISAASSYVSFYFVPFQKYCHLFIYEVQYFLHTFVNLSHFIYAATWLHYHSKNFDLFLAYCYSKFGTVVLRISHFIHYMQTAVMPHPHRAGAYALMAIVCLSVHLSRASP